uniref:Uncharacterized protein n=1 Tax=Rhizophora mucronata TaxID=61149 RepID=A0A2P2NH77_RHIMU
MLNMKDTKYQKVGKFYRCSGAFTTAQKSFQILKSLIPQDLRLHQNLILFCHLAAGSTHVPGMSWPSWRFWCFCITSPLSTGGRG